MSKSEKYSSKDDTDDIGNLTAKLALDLRKNMRSLGSFPILSPQWLEMAEIFGRIANISDMESKLPSPKEDATLWETEEQALRYLIEDGKLNLCLRNMIQYKEYQRQQNDSAVEQQEFASECDKFEKGLGVVLRNAWDHVEALQTTDLTALINHIGNVFEAGSNNPLIFETMTDLHQRQEVMCFYYLKGLLRHIEDITEERFMPLIRERRIFMAGVRLLMVLYPQILESHSLVAIETLSLLVETEDFSTHKDLHVVGQIEIDYLSDFKASCLTMLLSTPDRKRLGRALLDCIDRTVRRASISFNPSPRAASAIGSMRFIGK